MQILLHCSLTATMNRPQNVHLTEWSTYNKQLLWQVPTIIDASVHWNELLYSGLFFHTWVV